MVVQKDICVIVQQNKDNSILNFKALNSVQKPIFVKLEEYLGPQGIAEADRTLARLGKSLDDSFKDKTVLVAYGGGKDSSYMTAFIRYLQLKILKPENINDTFTMRVVTNRQSNMPNTVMENIDRVFQALGIYKDKNVESLVVDGDNVTRLSSELPLTKFPIPKEVIKRDRKDMLMAGHITQAEGRRVYCDACNAYMQKGEAHAITAGKGVNLIITGDSLKELVHYKNWIDRLYEFVTKTPQSAKPTAKEGFMD